ncbi:MAG: putative hemolysin [Cyclobacteriaceae bacterium]
MLVTLSDDPLPTLLLNIFASVDPSFLVINGLIIALLLAFSGMISGSEVAFFSLLHDQIKNLNTSTNPKDKIIASLVVDPKKLLATILILNNLVNIFIVTISTYATWKIVGNKDTGGIVIIVLTVSITILIIFIGEIVPKVYANHNNLQFARLTASMLQVAKRFFSPLSWVLMSLSKIIESKVEKKGYNLSVDEIHQALEITSEKEVSDEEKGMLKGIVNFSTLSVKQVMKSRMDITALDMETDFHELMNQINKTGYSRIPVYSENIDKIEGILYIKDLLPFLDSKDTYQWQSLLRPAYFVPESKKIDVLFKDFQEKQVHMAIVIDEYGGTSGLITLEDVIEEIVGEINDEFDEGEENAYNKLDKNTFIFEGKTSLNDFCKIICYDAQYFEEVKGDSESIGGLLLELNAKLPNAGEKITYKAFTFTVVAVDQKRIKKVRIYIKPEEKDPNFQFED